jgi:hypothetical protein
VVGPYWRGYYEWLGRTGVGTVSGWGVLAWVLWVAGPYWRGYCEWLGRTGVGTEWLEEH